MSSFALVPVLAVALALSTPQPMDGQSPSSTPVAEGAVTESPVAGVFVEAQSGGAIEDAVDGGAEPVPEPSTLLIVGLGLVALALHMANRRRRPA